MSDLTTEASSPTVLRYPIGGPLRAESFTPQQRSVAIEGLRQLPQSLRSAVADFSAQQLDTPYRPGGWTVRQLVHHVADSHINSYVRVRLALTEDWPTIKSYSEALWAELEDARTAAVPASLDLLQALHARWVLLFESLDERGWKRGHVHPENGRQSLEQIVVLYDWHGRHHTAHVTQLSARMGW
jgi:DinB superfamily